MIIFSAAYFYFEANIFCARKYVQNKIIKKFHKKIVENHFILAALMNFILAALMNSSHIQFIKNIMDRYYKIPNYIAV